MKTIVRAFNRMNNSLVVKNLDSIELIEVKSDSVLSIDASTTNTGMAIIERKTGIVLYTISAKRDSSESPVEYKVHLKREIADLLLNNELIQIVIKEEPFIQYVQAVKNLYMLSTMIEEVVEENLKLKGIKRIEVSNNRWKKLFLHPDKIPQGSNSEQHKQIIKDKLLREVPAFNILTQDEIDAVAMGCSVNGKLNESGAEDIESQTKPRPFKFEVQFIGSDTDEEIFEDFYNLCKAPKALLEKGIVFIELKSRNNFEKTIYRYMGNEDRILVLKFKSNTFGNIILQYKAGRVAQYSSYVYAIIWRKNRKLK